MQNIDDSEVIITQESESDRTIPGEQRRPRLSMNDLIQLEDFRTAEEVAVVREKYDKKSQVNRCLNEIYVSMERGEEINGWNSRKKRTVQEWKNALEFQFTVNWFFLYQLKETESFWSWCIIVISTLTSTLSLVRPDDAGLKITTQTGLSTFSMVTTLVAAWVKKCNYVERIKIIDRYIQKLSKLNIEIEYIMSHSPWDRMSFDEFTKTYEQQITNLLSSPPPMSPQEFKTTVWQLTKFYPELVKNTYPWYDRDEKGKYAMTDWGATILSTYEAVYYSVWYRRLFSWYYCTCRCYDCKNCNYKGSENYIKEMYSCETSSNSDQETVEMVEALRKARGSTHERDGLAIIEKASKDTEENGKKKSSGVLKLN